MILKKMKWISVFVLPLSFLTSCFSPSSRYTPMIPGTYLSKDTLEDQPFKQLRYTLTEISKDEFDSAETMNVIEDVGTPKSKRKYYSFIVELWMTETNEFEMITTLDIHYQQGTPMTFIGKMRFSSDYFDYEGSFTFISTNMEFGFDGYWFHCYATEN